MDAVPGQNTAGDRGRKSTEYARQPLEPVSDGRNAWLGPGTKDARLVVVDPPSNETGEPETAQDDARMTGVDRWSYSWDRDKTATGRSGH